MTTLYDDQSLFGADRPSEIMQSPSGIGVSSDETGAFDQGQFAPADVGLGLAPATTPSAPAAPQPATAQPSLFDRIGTGLYNFGAGMQGKPLWGHVQAEEHRKKKHADLEDIKGTVTALEHGMTMLQGVEGDARDEFVNAYAKRLDGIQDGMGNTFRSLAKKPDLLSQFKDYAQYLPEPMQIMLKSQPKEFLKLAGTPDGVKMLTGAKDQVDMRVATKKVQSTIAGLQQFVPEDKLKKIMADGVVTASDVLSVQEHLPKELQLSESQIQAIQRNDKIFWQGLGVLHGDKEQEVLANRAKAGDKNTAPPHMDVDGKRYVWDPEKKLGVDRLKTDPRYSLAGGTGSPDADKKRMVDIELKLSDDYRQDTKKFAERKPIFESATDYMANRAENKTSAGDAALAFAYAKSRDPNDRLAVSETRDLAKLGNMFERIGVNIVGVLDKGETLPDRVAKEMYAEIRRAFTEQNNAQGKVEADYHKKVKDYGGDSSRVVRPLAIPDLDRRQSDKPGDGLERKKIGGVSYVKKNGQWYEER